MTSSTPQVVVVELCRHQGGLVVICHRNNLTSETVGHYYADLASYRAAREQAAAICTKSGAEFIDAT